MQAHAQSKTQKAQHNSTVCCPTRTRERGQNPFHKIHFHQNQQQFIFLTFQPLHFHQCLFFLPFLLLCFAVCQRTALQISVRSLAIRVSSYCLHVPAKRTPNTLRTVGLASRLTRIEALWVSSANTVTSPQD